MKCWKTKCQKFKPRLVMKTVEMLEGPRAGHTDLGDEPNDPSGLG